MPNWCSNLVIIEAHQTDRQPTNELLIEIENLLKGPDDAPFPIHTIYQANHMSHFKIEPQSLRDGVIGTKESVFSFQKILPIPEKLLHECIDLNNPKENDKAIFISDIRSPNNLRSRFWDTKWSQVDEDLVISDNQLIYTFDTAWSAPLSVFRKLYELLKDYPVTITTHSYEPGSVFGFTLEGSFGFFEELEWTESDLETLPYEIFGYELEEDDDDDF